MFRRPWLLFGLLLLLAVSIFAASEFLLYMRSSTYAVTQKSAEADLKAAHEADLDANREIGEQLNAAAVRAIELEARAKSFGPEDPTPTPASVDFLAIERAHVELTHRLNARPEVAR